MLKITFHIIVHHIAQKKSKIRKPKIQLCILYVLRQGKRATTSRSLLKMQSKWLLL